MKDENFKNVTLATVLPFTYLVRNNPEEINFEDYKETISFAKENDILINMLSKKELTQVLYNEQTRLFNKNFFEYVLNDKLSTMQHIIQKLKEEFSLEKKRESKIKP